MNNRRTGKVARLPKERRDVVNMMLQDGASYEQIIAALGEAGRELNEVNLSAWKAGGYEDWLKEQGQLEDMRAKREFAFDIVKSNQGTNIHEAGMQLAASQLYELVMDFDLSALKTLLQEKPENYAEIVNALTKLSKGALEIQKYKDAMAKAQKELAKLRDPKADLSDTERNAILDTVDQVLGLK